jgi:hypothetical protein
LLRAAAVALWLPDFFLLITVSGGPPRKRKRRGPARPFSGCARGVAAQYGRTGAGLRVEDGSHTATGSVLIPFFWANCPESAKPETSGSAGGMSSGPGEI